MIKKHTAALHEESGRTMLEMLGVLAIMGIITYGAIAGINYGMTSYKVNQTYNEVQDIVQGVQDLYSWSKGYDGTNLVSAAVKNDVCQKLPSSDQCHGAFGDIDLVGANLSGNIWALDNHKQESSCDNFAVIVPITDEDSRTRVSDMDWAAVNIGVNCTGGEVHNNPVPGKQGACVFIPK